MQKSLLKTKLSLNGGLRLILKGISESQKPVLYRLIELYAQEQVKNCSIPDVVGQSEQLKDFLDYCEEAGWIKNIDKMRVIKDYEQSL